MVSAGITTLVVAELYPWPATDGYRQRLHNIVGGLSQVSTVDVVAPDRPGMPPPEDPPWERVRRSLTVPVGGPQGPGGWVIDWVRGDLPRRLLSVDWSLLVDELAAWRDRYDLIWYSHVDAWEPTHDLFGSTPAIVDFDNLENLSMRLRRRIPPRFGHSSGAAPADRIATTVRWATSRCFDLVDEHRWDAVQRRCAAQVEHVVVCSPLDVERSRCPNAVVVANGAEPPAQVRTDRASWFDDRPSLLFVGALDYEPNAEAVSWFVEEVWPVVLAGRADARLRVVGRGGEALGRLVDAPGVELLGAVSDLGPELERADISIVPVRFGSGTRLKVVEALANHIPVVTTTAGCEGIDVVDGRTALIADDPTSFAGAVLRLVADGSLRQGLADGGRALFDDCYSWSGIRDAVAEIAASSVAASRTEPSRTTAGE